jgi:predicted ester cyclase
MSEQHKILERRLIEGVWNRGNYAMVDDLIASDYLGHASTPTEETHGREGYKQFYVTLRTAFPDLHFTIEDQIVEGDRAVTR